MKNFFLTMITFIFIFATVAFSGEIDISLQKHLSNYQDDEFIPIIIFLNEQANIKHLDTQLTVQRATRKYRHQVIVEALQQMAKSTQNNLKNFLQDRADQNLIRDLRGYWIINGFSCKINKSIVSEIANHPDVKKVYFDAPMELIEPVSKNGPRDMGSRGVEQGLKAIRVDEVWAMGITGAGTIVSSLDTGVDGNHPALQSRWRGNFAPPEECFYDAVNPANHTPFDSGQHGTHTMGTITGLGEATGDTIGVAWGAHWIAAASIDYSDHSGYIASFEWIADPDGDPFTDDEVPDVCSNSWGTTQYEPCDDLFWEAIDNCEAAGVIVVFAVGNEGTSGPIRRPGDRAESLYDSYTVGATEKNYPYNIANFSTRGPTPCGNGDLSIKPEVSAPGVDIRSSVPGGGYEGGWNGTSMATPHVAGVLALMRELNPNIESQVAKQILIDTAMDLGSPGEDNNYGWGLIDAYEAIQATYETMSSFEGAVKDLFTTQPLRETTISTLSDQTRVAISEDDGFYHLATQPGEHYLTAERFGYYDFVSNIEYQIGAPETLQVDIYMNPLPAGSLSGFVTDIQGNAVEGAQLTPLDVPMDPVFSDATGYYEFDPIPGDFTYDVEAWSGSHDTQIQEIIVPVEGFSTLDFVMYPVQSFEENDGTYYGEGFMNEWQWGIPTEEGGPSQAYHGENLWGIDLDGLYEPSRQHYLYTPQYHLYEGNNLYLLKFYHWYEMNDGWDGGNVQILVDGEEDWALLTPEEGYPDNSVVGLSGSPGYTGQSGDGEDIDWEIATFDLSDYIGQTVSFRFRFASTNEQERGWFVDHVVIYGSVEPASYIKDSFTETVPSNFALFQNYPNPFNPETEIRYNIPQKSHVELSIYNSEGKLIKNLVGSEKEQGAYSVNWNGTDSHSETVPSGMYIYTIKAGDFEQSRRLILLK